MDPLSDVLRAVNLAGAFFYAVEARAPWCVELVAARELAPRLLPEAEHLISYHILTEGTCWGGLADEPPIEMRAGDVIVFPHGDPHRMADAPRPPGSGDPGTQPARYRETLCLGPSGPVSARFVCGFFGCDRRPYNPLLATLPRRILLRGVDEGWLGTFARQVVAESRAPRAGSDSVLARLAELMFIEVLRRHVEQLPPGQAGWLAGLRDPVVGRALALLHERPAHAWSLAELAGAVASSRSRLAERFTAFVGEPPIQYLARWRMQLAAGRLATTSAKVAAVGAEVGYESEAAFSRAFKKVVGVSPAAWRAQKVGGARAG